MGISERSYRFPHWGPLLVETKMDQEFVDLLLEKGSASRKKHLDARKNLAGMIDNEYYYEDYESWFAPKFNIYVNLYKDALVTKWLPGCNMGNSWNLDRLWINYQKAGEYNPPHNHSGDLSFVIYLQVPDAIKNEYEENKGQRKNSGPGTINFDVGIKSPFAISSFAKFPEEGDILIFPSWVPHFVNDFKSDVERISVSGNIFMIGDS